MGGYKGILDILKNVNNCKYDFSPYKRLTNTYKGNKLYIKRTSDSASNYIHTSDYDRNGNINSSEIAAWANGGDVLLHDCYSETSGEKAYQSDVNKAPKIVVSGVFQNDGVKFNGVNNYMKVIDYAAIQIINPSLSVYLNFYPKNISNRFIFAKNEISNPVQYGVWGHATADTSAYLDGSSKASLPALQIKQYKLIYEWKNTLSGGLRIKDNYNNINSTSLNTILTNKNKICIGGWFTNNSPETVGLLFNGNIKTLLIFNSNEYDNYNNLSNYY